MDEAKDSITSIHLSKHEMLVGCVCVCVWACVLLGKRSKCLFLLRHTYCSSVDGKARRYDIRFGKLYTDTIGRESMH